MHSEVKDYDTLLNMGESIFSGVCAEKVLFKDKIFEIEKSSRDESYYLNINMPFVDKSELNLLQKGDEISISIKNEKRNFVLPQKLHSKKIIKANYESGKLRIQFN
jgi:arsenite-transporting ATPase